MKFLTVLATIMGLLVAALGVLGITAPTLLLDFGRSLPTPTALYGVAAVRVLFGALLISVASASRWPGILRAVGAVIVIAGFLTPVFGVERSAAIVAWLSGQEPMLVRAAAVLPLLLGLFLAYTVNSRRHVAA